jgi:hypothetical protein
VSDVLEASLELPTLVFTGLGALCAVLWVLTLVGVVDVGGGEEAADGLLDDALEPLGLADVPMLVLLSIVTIVGWVVSVVAQLYLLESATGLALAGGAIGVGVVSLVASLGASKAVAPALSRALRPTLAAGAQELVGRIAEIRSHTVTETSGYADTTWPDGRGERVNVRTSHHGEIGPDILRSGDRVLLIAWDEASNSYIVAPIPADLT